MSSCVHLVSPLPSLTVAPDARFFLRRIPFCPPTHPDVRVPLSCKALRFICQRYFAVPPFLLRLEVTRPVRLMKPIVSSLFPGWHPLFKISRLGPPAFLFLSLTLPPLSCIGYAWPCFSSCGVVRVDTVILFAFPLPFDPSPMGNVLFVLSLQGTSATTRYSHVFLRVV